MPEMDFKSKADYYIQGSKFTTPSKEHRKIGILVSKGEKGRC